MESALDFTSRKHSLKCHFLHLLRLLPKKSNIQTQYLPLYHTFQHHPINSSSRTTSSALPRCLDLANSSAPSQDAPFDSNPQHYTLALFTLRPTTPRTFDFFNQLPPELKIFILIYAFDNRSGSIILHRPDANIHTVLQGILTAPRIEISLEKVRCQSSWARIRHGNSFCVMSCAEIFFTWRRVVNWLGRSLFEVWKGRIKAETEGWMDL